MFNYLINIQATDQQHVLCICFSQTLMKHIPLAVHAKRLNHRWRLNGRCLINLIIILIQKYLAIASENFKLIYGLRRANTGLFLLQCSLRFDIKLSQVTQQEETRSLLTDITETNLNLVAR